MAYLNNLPLSSRAKRSVWQFIDYAIANADDTVRNDPAFRFGPGHLYFTRQLLLRDWWGDRGYHTLDFVVLDAPAAMGVLVIVYVEHR
jgi:hypothetical protein